MLDLLAAIFMTAVYATVMGVLISLSRTRVVTKLAIFAAAVAWLAVISAAAALGGLAPGALGPLPATLLPFTALLVLLFGGWYFFPRVRSAVLSVPLPALVAVNVGRVGGLFFLLLYWDGRLSAPFAPSAGVGDMITGALAFPLAAMLAFRFEIRNLWIVLWNAFGALDLIVAIVLGLLSAQGTPFRVFTEAPGHSGYVYFAMDLRAVNAGSDLSFHSLCDCSKSQIVAERSRLLNGRKRSKPTHANGSFRPTADIHRLLQPCRLWRAQRHDLPAEWRA